MKPKILFPILVVIALTFSGCGTVSDFTNPSGPTVTATPVPVNVNATDPVVVNAEKTLLIARDTFTLFVHLERDNRASLAKISPQFHQYAEILRRNGIKWLRTADAMKEAYKNNRTPESKANLLTALATVSEALNQTQQYIHKSQLNTP
jgi:hypothetical protein